MPVTAWQFSDTEAADQAVVKLKQFGEQDLIKVEDMAVIRWPQYAAAPAADEHVTVQGGKVSSMMHKITHDRIDSSMIDEVKDVMMPGTSALVLQSSDAVIDALAEAVGGPGVELLQSDLSVPQQDQLRAALADSPAPEPPPEQPPGALR
jgi:uncharacterized membrane protein